MIQVNGGDAFGIEKVGDMCRKYYREGMRRSWLEDYHIAQADISCRVRTFLERPFRINCNKHSDHVEDTGVKDVTLQILDLSLGSIQKINENYTSLIPWVSGLEAKHASRVRDVLDESDIPHELKTLLVSNISSMNVKVQILGADYKMIVTDLGSSIPRFLKEYKELTPS